MKQGEIWTANLNPSKASEQAGFRPVVIISGNLLNENLNVVMTVPLTTKVKRYKGNPILVPDKHTRLKKESEMLVFHVRSISKDRLTGKVGVISKQDLNLAMKTLNDILKY